MGKMPVDWMSFASEFESTSGSDYYNAITSVHSVDTCIRPFQQLNGFHIISVDIVNRIRFTIVTNRH